MVHVLGFALIATTLLATAAASAPPMTKDTYVEQWRGTVADERADRLLDALGAGREPSCRVCRAEPPASGREWIRAAEQFERLVRDDLDRLGSLHPPREVVRLHQSWLAGIRGCVDRIRFLMPLANAETQPRLDPRRGRKAADEFAILWARCSERLRPIFEQFRARGYVFSS